MLLIIQQCFNLQHRYFRNNEFADTKLNYKTGKATTQIFNQTADHFNPLDKSTFQQRYLVNDTFYKQGGPLLLFIGGEGTMNEAELQGKYNINYFAQQLNGFMVSLEHRYYGYSQPFANMSNLSLLSSRQALADCVEFIYYVKDKYNLSDSKVIAIGGSYSGNLAAWLRQKYPHIVDMAVSSSTPYFAKLNFPEYLKHSSDQFKAFGSDQCYTQLMNILQYGTQLLRNDSEKFAQLMKLKNNQLPKNMTTQDIATVEQEFWDYPTGLVQYQKAAGFNNSDYEGDIQSFCRQLQDQINGTTNISEQLMAYGNIVKLYSEGDLSYNAQKQYLANITIPNDGRAWTYQTCTEFGYYQTSDLVPSYGEENSIDYWLDLCQSVFYDSLDTQNGTLTENLISQTNRHYGARNLHRNQIIITNGGVDPWSELSAQRNGSWETGQRLPKDSGLFFIEYGSHCSDMYLDWTANYDVRTKQLQYLQKWLNGTSNAAKEEL